MTARRASASAVALTVLAVGVMLLMIMLAARTGPQRIIHGTLRDPSFAGTPTYQGLPNRPLPSTAGGRGLFPHNGFFRAVARVFEVAVLVCVLLLVYWGVRRVREMVSLRRHPPRPVPEHVDFDVLDDPEPLADEIREDAADQFALLLGGAPRNAIVACWDRFEEQAERVGAARKPWETSSEFTLRLLEAVAADQAAVRRLEGLYREARFSDHDIDESRRESALEALGAIHASLGAGVSPR